MYKCSYESGLRSPDQELYFQDVYRYTFSLFSDWTGPVNYYRNLTLSDYSDGQADIIISKKMSSKVETLLIVGNNDTDVSLDLVTKSAEIPERYDENVSCQARAHLSPLHPPTHNF